LKNDRQEKDVVARIGNGRTSGASPVSAARSACGQHVDKAEAPAPAAAAAAGDPDIMVRIPVYVRCTCTLHPRVAPCARCIAFVVAEQCVVVTSTNEVEREREGGREGERERERERWLRTSSSFSDNDVIFEGQRTFAYVCLSACLARNNHYLSLENGNTMVRYNCMTAKDACSTTCLRSARIILTCSIILKFKCK